MTRKLLATFILSVGCHVLFGQGNTAQRLQALETRISALDQQEYDTVRSTVLIALERFPVLRTEFDKLDNVSDLTQLMSSLSSAVNPNNSDLFGKSYTEVVKEQAEKILSVDLEGSAKSKFSQILSKVTSIPILGDFINTNPVASLANSVINSASNFFQEKISGCAFCKKTLEVAGEVKQNKINQFNQHIQPYVEYYDKVLAADRQFQSQVVQFKASYKEKYLEIENADEELNQIFGLTYDGSRVDQVSPFFALEGGSYFDVLQKEEVKKGHRVAAKYTRYRVLFDDYQLQFNKILGVYLKTYAEALNNMKNSVLAGEYNTDQINALIADIEKYIEKYDIRKAGAAWSEGELGPVFDNIDAFKKVDSGRP